MPTPGLRNKGQSLAEKVGETGHFAPLSDRHDHIHAARSRRDTQWEAAASALEVRAARARIDLGRAAQLQRYAERVRTGKAHPPPTESPAPVRPEPLPSYWLGFCLRCRVSIWVHSAKPRVPICAGCRR